MQACYSGRISDYLDARLPVLLNREIAFNGRRIGSSIYQYEVAIDLAGVLRPGFHDKLLAIKGGTASVQKGGTGGAPRRYRSARKRPPVDFYQRIISVRSRPAPSDCHIGQSWRRNTVNRFARAIEVANENSRRLW
jgi:hypothetical protein